MELQSALENIKKYVVPREKLPEQIFFLKSIFSRLRVDWRILLKLGARFETLCNGSRDLARTDRVTALSPSISLWVGKQELTEQEHKPSQLQDNERLNYGPG